MDIINDFPVISEGLEISNKSSIVGAISDNSPFFNLIFLLPKYIRGTSFKVCEVFT